MGSERSASCRDCGNHFTVMRGGGFRFHLLRCILCGQPRNVRLDQFGDLHARFLKGSETPYTNVFAEEHRHVREHVDIKPISDEEYYAGVEAAYNCNCGGELSFNAPPRCPACRSTQIVEGQLLADYD